MAAAPLTLFVAGDVMTGRGVDQVLAHPSVPDLHEPFVRDAREYVALARQKSGGVPSPVDDGYVWGDAAGEWARMAPVARIANLETSVTTSSEYDRGKCIHYRMHPANIGCLSRAGCLWVLANNHVLDYGRAGLDETLRILHAAGMMTTGAGSSLADASRPATVTLPSGGRLAVTACAHASSGVAPAWAAAADRSGVQLLGDLSEETAGALANAALAGKRRGDVAIVSIHWGDNWGYEVPALHVAFAHRLIDGGVDVVHGHSSHHPRPIEVYRGRLVLYGCGDFLNDYEGIAGYEQYRDELVLMYFPRLDPESGMLVDLQMTPMEIRGLRLNRATSADARWLHDTMSRISGSFGARVVLTPAGTLRLTAEEQRP